MPGDDLHPYVPPESRLPELTLQALVLGLVLSLIMCAANVYVGLYAGMTVSAAIPASVISMAVLRGILRRGTILENNIVHTIASSGESLAAGIIFTVPALVLLGIWTEFNYWETTIIALAGGLMGVLMMIPLRKAMIIDQKELAYPEGVACAEVLKAGDRGGAEMRGIFAALGLGGLFKVGVSVLGVFAGTAEGAWRLGRTVLYAGTDVSPMLMAVGFIVGFEISLLVFLGGAISFFGAVPFLAWKLVPSGGSLVEFVFDAIWDPNIRYFGIGAMVVGGVYSMVKVFASIRSGIAAAFRGLRGTDSQEMLPRTEQSISGRPLLLLTAACVVLTAALYFEMTGSALTTAVTTAVMVVMAFFFVAVASYIAGLVGSSNSPVSGMAICTVLITAGLLLVLGYTGTDGMLATLGVAGVVCCAACTSGDICQDLKIGQILGATPRRQQWAEVIGTAVPAFIIAPTMTLLHQAYGIGKPAREGVQALRAPQAHLFEKLVGTIFSAAEELPWDLVRAGAGVGIAAILIDRFFLAPRRTRFRLHVMPLAVGMYLPLSVTAPILFGGLAYLYVERRSRRRGDDEPARQRVIHRGLLFSSGLVAGEAILGIAVAGLLTANLGLPLLEGTPYAGEWSKWREVISLAALFLVVYLLVRKSLGRRRLTG
jgi:putative OPT family oligopeptide transporter